MKLRRTPRNPIERETSRHRAIADELRHHDPYRLPELVFAHEAALVRFWAAR